MQKNILVRQDEMKNAMIKHLYNKVEKEVCSDGQKEGEWI